MFILSACGRDNLTALVPKGYGAEISIDRKSTRLNSSHVAISYAVFCLKKKKTRTLRNSRARTSAPTTGYGSPTRIGGPPLRGASPHASNERQQSRRRRLASHSAR